MSFPLPVFDYRRPFGSLKEYFILLYFELISSQYYNEGKALLWRYSEAISLWYNLGNAVLGRTNIYVPFKLKNNLYKFPLILSPSSDVKKITDDKGNDLSEWAGPFKNFYGIKLTPKDLGCKKIIIAYNDGEVKTFEEDENITVMGV